MHSDNITSKLFCYHRAINTGVAPNVKSAISSIFSDKIISLTIPRLLDNSGHKSLTAIKFPNIPRFSRQVVTVNTLFCPFHKQYNCVFQLSNC